MNRILHFVLIIGLATSIAVSFGAAGQEQTQKVESAKVTKEDNKGLSISARIHTGWTMSQKAASSDKTSDEETLTNAFEVRRARLKMRWEPNERIMGEMQIEASDAFEAGGSILRNAYVHLSAIKQLEFRVGQFKRPFSGLELRSASKRRLINRGIGNDLIIEDLRYGGRDIGFQVSGRVIDSIKLDYAVAAFNGNGINSADWEDNPKDVLGRLRIRPNKRLIIGAGGAVKFFAHPVASQPSRAWAVGGDVRFKIKGVRLYAEGLVGQNWLAGVKYENINPNNPPLVIDAVAVLSYKHRFPVSWRFAVEPAFKFEFLDPDDIVVDDEVMMYTLGLNTYLGEYFRLMINGEMNVSSRNSIQKYANKKTLMIMACLDI